MNSVHEPGPNGDSETIPSRKIRSKTKPGARAPSWPAQVLTGARMATRGRSYCGRVPIVSWSRPWPCRGLHGRVVVCMAVSWPAWPYRRPPLGRVAAPRAQRPLCALCRAPVRLRPAPVSCRRHNARPCRRCCGCIAIQPCPFPLLPCHNTPGCIAIQPCLLQPFSRNTVNCIAIQFTTYPASPPNAIHFTPLNCIAIQFLSQPSRLYCNTLQCIATQFQPSKLPSLQYKPLYCNTKILIPAF